MAFAAGDLALLKINVGSILQAEPPIGTATAALSIAWPNVGEFTYTVDTNFYKLTVAPSPSSFALNQMVRVAPGNALGIANIAGRGQGYVVGVYTAATPAGVAVGELVLVKLLSGGYLMALVANFEAVPAA